MEAGLALCFPAEKECPGLLRKVVRFVHCKKSIPRENRQEVECNPSSTQQVASENKGVHLRIHTCILPSPSVATTA